MFQEKFVQIADEANIKKIIVTDLTQSMSFANRTRSKTAKRYETAAVAERQMFL